MPSVKNFLFRGWMQGDEGHVEDRTQVLHLFPIYLPPVLYYWYLCVLFFLLDYQFYNRQYYQLLVILILHDIHLCTQVFNTCVCQKEQCIFWDQNEAQSVFWGVGRANLQVSQLDVAVESSAQRYRENINHFYRQSSLLSPEPRLLACVWLSD